jgi:DNA-binding NarL/FixJ family response regulator
LILLEQKKITSKIPEYNIRLTARQQQIFNLITTKGTSNKHIARVLLISESTVKLHVGCILKKYGVRNRTQLAVFAQTIKPTIEV